MIYLFFNSISIDRSKRHFVLKIYFLILICQSRVLNILLNSTISRIEGGCNENSFLRYVN